MLDAARARVPAWRRLGLTPDLSEMSEHYRNSTNNKPPFTLMLAVYVDNVFSIAATGTDALAIQADLERYVAEHWRLQIKPGSREIIVPAGVSCAPPPAWKLVKQFRCLGHFISDNNTFLECWERTCADMWLAWHRLQSVRGYS